MLKLIINWTFLLKYPTTFEIFSFIYINLAHNIMTTEVTEGIQITVKSFYRPEFSNPLKNHFLYTYRITIENIFIKENNLIIFKNKKNNK